ncbi:hypothetical protein I7I50_05895 [Histoplasma capsulatum G186AR]|uniref:Uncharacterized protein n=1 Tax=Ajellomyces capsulatus TaxID=5037 RepID=A0A8H8D824_AJECA|nr:hypothetical protein I7I52_04154 [Histoplasma capsulatum]QSS76442.1 hypothetical protein I7I50_05895 [Histoplasma capsulatum G186AR]
MHLRAFVDPLSLNNALIPSPRSLYLIRNLDKSVLSYAFCLELEELLPVPVYMLVYIYPRTNSRYSDLVDCDGGKEGSLYHFILLVL